MKKTFGKLFGNILKSKYKQLLRGLKLSGLRDLLMIVLFLFVNSLSFSQTPNELKIYGEINTVFLNDLQIGSEIETDTIDLSGSWHLWGDNGKYFRFPDCGDIIKIESDSVYAWQKDINVIRVRSFGETTYTNTNKIPFQFIKDTINRVPAKTSYRIQTFATEKHCAKYFVDNIHVADNTSCNPSSWDYHGYNIFRHTQRISNLEPDTEYLIRVRGTTNDGSINTIEFKIKTLP